MGRAVPTRVCSEDLQFQRSRLDNDFYSSATGIYAIADKIDRDIPLYTDDVTYESVHPSVDKQRRIRPDLAQALNNDASLQCSLQPLETEIRDLWQVSPERAEAYESTRSNENGGGQGQKAHVKRIHDSLKTDQEVVNGGEVVEEHSFTHSMNVTKSSEGKPVSVEEHWVEEISSFGKSIRGFVEKFGDSR